MELGYTDIRDKTFIMLSRLDGDQQESYALAVENYVSDPKDYDEMTEYLNFFNRAETLAAFMNDSVNDEDVVRYDHKLHPALLEVRGQLDEMSLSDDQDNYTMARRLTFFLLADMKDDFEWLRAGKDKTKLYDDKGGGSNHSTNDFDMM